MRRCPHCMHPSDGLVCPDCGGDMDTRNGFGQLPVGTVLDDSWLIGAALGQGGFGITYVGMDIAAERRVAVKEFFPTKCARRAADNITVVPQPGMEQIYDGGRSSFVTEARTLAELEDIPSAVRGVAYLELNQTAYLVMEYLDGRPLYKLVRERKHIPAEELFPPLRVLMEDIGKLHRSGVIHRDIAPDNIMWMPDGSLKLLDFGNARSIENGKSMTVLLKKGFAPVEQYGTRGQGPWTDVYAIAATIYYGLTGVIPPDAAERLQNDVPVASAIALGAAITPEEEAALMKGLAVRPKERPQDMDAFIKLLFPVEVVQKTAQEPAPVVKTGPLRYFFLWLRRIFRLQDRTK